MFIGGTALVTKSFKPQERAKAQGLHDFMMFSCVAIAAFGSGKLFFLRADRHQTWDNMAVLSLVGTVVVIAANAWLLKKSQSAESRAA